MDRKIVCFHNAEEENGYLSNWYLSEFSVDSVIFSSMEQYMMFQKAKLFGDMASIDKILAINDVAKIKAMGREVSNYNDVIWNGMRQIIVYHGLLEKFKQNKELKSMLLKTGNHILAECAVRDRIWGIGLSMTDENRFSIDKWKGQNLLGFTLMQVRSELAVATDELT